MKASKKAGPAHSPSALSAISALFQRDPTELKPWATNARTHSEAQLVMLMASITEYGFTAPVLIDENSNILAGHGRVLAALRLKLPQVPTVVLGGLTQAQKRAYVIADNKTAQLSGWNGDLLKAEFEVLIREEFQIELTGFSTAEVDLTLDAGTKPPNDDPDDELPEETLAVVTRLNDVWQLGDHRLMCASALDPSAYHALMVGQVAQMCITDPPYNVKIAGHVCGNGKKQHKNFIEASGEKTPQEFIDFLGRALGLVAKFTQNGGIVFTFMDWRHLSEILEAARPVLGAPRQICVWVKDNGGMGTFYRSQHEFVPVFKNGDAPHINNFELGQHGRYRTNVWNYPGVNTFTGRGYELLALHPTVKPVSMIADAIRDCSTRKGVILDPFAGSGTVILAAERTGRRARAIELDPQYVDVGVRRWQERTGKLATLEATGRTWDEVAAERLPSNEWEAS